MNSRVGATALAEVATERPTVVVPRDEAAIWKIWHQHSQDRDLYRVLLDPARFCLEGGLQADREGLSAAAVKERQQRRRDARELAALEKQARAG